MNTRWNNTYPSKELLRKDVNALVDSTNYTLFKYFNKKDIYGIYYKGSSSKQWGSIIDYVPGISDVDIHVQFINDKIFDKVIHNPDVAMKFSEDNEKQFRSISKKIYHMPELQLNSLNNLHHNKDYRSTPSKAVKVLYGRPYPINKIAEKTIKKISHDQISELKTYIDKLPNRILDKNSLSMKKFLKDLSWRINPQAANFLVFHDVNYDDAFSMNRTDIVSTLRKVGFKDEAKDFEGFYYYAWKYFLKNKYSDMKNAILCGHKFLDMTVSNVE
jgi:hypothetical protein